MRDPHVVSLTYRLETDDSLSFDAPPLEHETEAFALCLDDDVLTVEMKAHFASVEAARDAVEPLLTSWEVHVALANRDEIAFEYEDAEVVDRNPPEPGDDVVLRPDSGVYRMSLSEPSIHITRGKYPSPPEHFEASPEVEVLLKRYQRCLNGSEQIIPLAYFCLTVVESKGRGRARAAKQLNISSSLLNRVGDLTARGDLESARKWNGDDHNRPLSEKEQHWLEEAVRLLILRLGAYAARPEGPFEKLTRADLPPLE